MATNNIGCPSLPSQVLDLDTFRFADDEGSAVCLCSCSQGTSNLGPGTRRIPMYSSFRGVALAGCLHGDSAAKRSHSCAILEHYPRAISQVGTPLICENQ